MKLFTVFISKGGDCRRLFLYYCCNVGSVYNKQIGFYFHYQGNIFQRFLNEEIFKDLGAEIVLQD